MQHPNNKKRGFFNFFGCSYISWAVLESFIRVVLSLLLFSIHQKIVKFLDNEWN